MITVSKRSWVTPAALAVAAVLPFVLPDSLRSAAVFIIIAAIGVQGINIIIGLAGQVSFGHAFFLGIGAYTAATLGGNLGMDGLIWLPAAGLVAAAIGAVVAPIAVRLRGLYLAIVTIALVVVGQYLFLNLRDLTGGPTGRSIPALRFGGLDMSAGQELVIGPIVLNRDDLYFYTALIVLIVASVFVRNLIASRPGRAMIAIREGELSAAVLGVDVTRTKVSAFALSAFWAGISGALYGSYLTYVLPEQWSLHMSVQYIAALVIGGSATVWGPIVGAAIVFALPSVIELIPIFHDNSGSGVASSNIASILYAVIVIALLVKQPTGVVGLVRSLARKYPLGASRRLSH